MDFDFAADAPQKHASAMRLSDDLKGHPLTNVTDNSDRSRQMTVDLQRRS